MHRMVLIVALVLATGCVRPEVIRVSGTPRPAVEPSAVEVLLERPTRPYRVIAQVSINESIGRGLEEMQRQLVVAAAREGGDALLLYGITREPSGAVLVPAGTVIIATPLEEKRLSGEVIVWE